MNLHWGKTLEHKWVKVKNRPLNYTIYNQYNYTEYKLTAHKYYWSDALLSTNRTGNQSALYAENQFLKKSKIMTDLFNPSVRSQSFTTVVVIASIFLFLTMTITAAVVVFCRKRNSVFVFQKSEQEDTADYELDDINTDVEYTETEFESETESIRLPRKPLGHAAIGGMAASAGGTRSDEYGGGGPGGAGGGESDFENSPARRPLVSGLQNESEAEDSPIRRHRTCRCGGTADPRGQYQRMVVTAVLEKPQRPSHLGSGTSTGGGTSGGVGGSSDDESGYEAGRTRYIQKLDPRLYYQRFDGDHHQMLAAAAAAAAAENGGKTPVINITYADDPPAYDSLDYYTAGESNTNSNNNNNHKHTVTVDIEKYAARFPLPLTLDMESEAPGKSDMHYENLPRRDSEAQTDKSAFPPDTAVVFVELPPKEKDLAWPEVCYIDLPPKADSSTYQGARRAPPPPPPAPVHPPPPVPSTPTTPLAPPSTPTGGVIGLGLSVLGVVSMSPPDEDEEEEAEEIQEERDEEEEQEEEEEEEDEEEEQEEECTPPELPPRRYLPAYRRIETMCSKPDPEPPKHMAQPASEQSRPA